MCGLTGLFLSVFVVYAQIPPYSTAEKQVRNKIVPYFEAYRSKLANINSSGIRNVEVDTVRQFINIYGNNTFSTQPFTKQVINSIYADVKSVLPKRFANYKITVYADGLPIERQQSDDMRNSIMSNRLWRGIDYTGKPWVRNISVPYRPSKGLDGRHIALWASHGRYFKQALNCWNWQRPSIFATSEDLFTQTIVVPFLIPMLERSGAIVYTPRERDWQELEAIVDNDHNSKGTYKEYGKGWGKVPAPGFAHAKETYLEGDNPFTDGTARMIATSTKGETASAEWIPDFDEAGNYAVYVSYQPIKWAVNDAQYTIVHGGIKTVVKVNQQMGGGTWVYLGTFAFGKGNGDDNKVVLSNYSSTKGFVSADAVRFGGGMGNVARGLDGETPTTSGMPRFLEGARYSMQWAGMPYEVYSSRQGTNDYPDDINARPYAINYLSGGSVYNPGLEGQKVPFELSLAVHSDAGFRKDDQLIGTLGIYTLQNEGIDVFNTGVSRYTSRNATELALQEVQNEIRTAVPEWPRRRLVNDNYSETRNPEFPSFIVETLSHQNFSDLHYGQDPYFKFLLARGIYKAVLKYVNLMHGTNEVVQPLPVRSFAIAQPNLRESAVTLSWKPTADKRSPSSAPTGYILYTRKGDADFDNGMYIGNGKTSISVLLDSDELYDFKVTAVNDGGESMDSEVLSAYISSKSLSSKKKSTMLIVNAFTRLCGPAEINNDSLQGFDIKAEYGVPYKMFPGFSGEQTCFTKSTIGKETEDGLGFSNRQMNGKIVTGNTFDYPHTHGKAVAELKGWSFVSCSKEAFEEMGSTSGYTIIDIIGGLQKEDWSLTSKPLFSEGMKNQLKTFLNKGGKVLLTGAYIASGLTNNADSIFASRWLKYCDGERTSDSIPVVIRQDKMSYEIYTDANKYSYAVQHPSGLIGVNGSIPLADFDGQDICAAVAYGRGKYRVVCSSVPLECIKDEKLRNKTMEQYIKFLAK